jgi:hypothetical protein
MTIEALSMTLCLASGIFGRPAWSPEKCLERATQISRIAEEHQLDPMMFVAINIQECDMRENVDAKFYAPAQDQHKGLRSKSHRLMPKQLGIDACPMGMRIWWPNGRKPEKTLDALALYELAGKKMARWKRWCEKNHKGHYFVAHWNEGNRVYATQVLAFRSVLLGRPIKAEDSLTSRSKEIVRRLQRAQRDRRS